MMLAQTAVEPLRGAGIVMPHEKAAPVNFDRCPINTCTVLITAPTQIEAVGDASI